MKNFFLIIIAAFTICTSQGQTWAEWFQQKKTQQKYLIQQIAALQVYLGYVEKGYDIAKKGLDVIQEFKNGEFKLHETFFNSLKAVNPTVKNGTEVVEIIALQISIVNHFKDAIKTYKETNQFNSYELNYINKVYTILTSDGLKDIDALMSVVTDDSLQMSDDERMQQINSIYAHMQDKNSFTQYFTNSANMLANHRALEQNDISVSKGLYGLPH
jgi:hypothetical protein